MNQAEQKAWEGLGGPVQIDRPNLDGIDPTLDSCCRREEEGNRYANVKRRALQRHDVVAAKERSRRNLVNTAAFTGCRCCYDPNSDGTGDYRALIELRERLRDEGREEDLEGKKFGGTNDETGGIGDNNDDDDEEEEEDDDDEFDYLLDEDLPGDQDDSLKAYEEQRRAELEEAMSMRERAVQHGYGVHRQLHPTRILKATGLVPGMRDPAPAVVLHLVDPDSIASATLDVYLERVAEKNAPGTKFMRSGGRSTLLMDADLAAKALPRLQPDRDLPALVFVKDGVAVGVCPRLSGLVDENDCVVEDAVHNWLDRSGALLSTIPPLEEICHIRPEEEALMDYLASSVPTAAENCYNCGVPDCQKTYPHEHNPLFLHSEEEEEEEEVLAVNSTTASTN